MSDEFSDCDCVVSLERNALLDSWSVDLGKGLTPEGQRLPVPPGASRPLGPPGSRPDLSQPGPPRPGGPPPSDLPEMPRPTGAVPRAVGPPSARLQTPHPTRPTTSGFSTERLQQVEVPRSVENSRNPSRNARQMRRVAVKVQPSLSLRPCHRLRARAHTKLGAVKIVGAGQKWLNRRFNRVLLPLEAWLCCNQQSILSYQT